MSASVGTCHGHDLLDVQRTSCAYREAFSILTGSEQLEASPRLHHVTPQSHPVG